MRILNFLFIMMAGATLSVAQVMPINFETGGNGANWTWTVFENATNPALEIVNNPSTTGINTSAKVAKFTALKAGQVYAGTESSHGTKDLGPFTLDSTNNIIKIMVYKTTISNVGVKFASSTGWAQPELKVSNTRINVWEELTFDFSGYLNPPASEGKLDQIIIFPDFAATARAQDNVVYFDNITFNKKITTAANEPTTAAPNPTRNAADVISLYSNAYTNVPVDTWRTSWSSATLTDVSIAGNATKKYSSLDFVGIETVSKQIDISGMTHIHLDVWSPDFTSFGIKIVDFGSDGAFQGGNDVEHQVNVPMPNKSQWVSLDIPLTDFVGLITKKNIAQYILVGSPTGSTTVFVDNIYFYKGSAAPAIEPTSAAPTPARNAADVISLFSNAYTNVPVDIWRTSWSAATLTDVSVAGNATKKYSSLDFVGIETVSKQIDISGMTHIHLDVWSPDFTSFGIKIVDFGSDGAFQGGNDVEHQVNIPMTNKSQWVSLDLPLTAFTGLITKKNIAQYILVGIPTGATTVFIDNMYFYNDKTVATNDLSSIVDKIKVYPNILNAGDIIYLSDEVNVVDIIDASGRILKSLKSSTLNTEGLTPGIYVLKIQTKDNLSQTSKVIIK
jgi:hypothetical protein